MIRTAVTNSAKQEFLQGIHSPEDIYKIALYDENAKLDEGTKIYLGKNEVKSAGYESGGKILAGYSIVSDKGTAILTFDDPSWNLVSMSARGAMIYNSSKENRAVAVFDFGENITATNGTFIATIPRATAADGLIRIA